ncbi:MAG: HIT family protein [Candidatus Micrarchaeota archaeon]|nr:HIT family protein [Candidatus Micrarchaeota archaeon]MDE1823992.1 HIT family protein [Candidatus Micrarchaeota archaeon]MDE1849990.1 HIT family protein [Candidatus Micrarchaeota archaeon]
MTSREVDNCIFCKIVRGDADYRMVAQSGSALAFLDVHPISEGHTLVIPKRHYATMDEMPKEEYLAVQGLVKDVSELLKDSLGADGLNITSASGRAAGQEVGHLHIHVVPRYENDGIRLRFHNRGFKSSLDETLARIRAHVRDVDDSRRRIFTMFRRDAHHHGSERMESGKRRLSA